MRRGVDLWTGRVFCDRGRGGNVTAIVRGATPDEMPAIAGWLGFPDTGFVIDADSRSLVLRTFSPHEELELCLQTSYAVAVAADLERGRSWAVSHASGSSVDVVRAGSDAGELVSAEFGRDLVGPPRPARDPAAASAGSLIVGTSRPRRYTECASLEGLLGLSLSAREVQAICLDEEVRGLVWYHLAAGGVRVRVFTMSLDGEEDTATGGAVAALGWILHDRIRGEIKVVQGGSEDPARQGSMVLLVEEDAVHLRTEVQPLDPYDPRGPLVGR